MNCIIVVALKHTLAHMCKVLRNVLISILNISVSVSKVSVLSWSLTVTAYLHL